MLERTPQKHQPPRTCSFAFTFKMQIVMISVFLFPLCGWEVASEKGEEESPAPHAPD